MKFNIHHGGAEAGENHLNSNFPILLIFPPRAPLAGFHAKARAKRYKVFNNFSLLKKLHANESVSR
jgi:hypothetical protein